MKLGVVNEETWDFFTDVYESLAKVHDTTLFQRRMVKSPVFHSRINRRLLSHDLSKLMINNDVVFFEWASELLAFATHLPKKGRIITRLHRYELYKWAKLIDWDVVDKVILVSQEKEREFLEKFPECSHKTEVVPVSISLERFKLSDKKYSGNIGILCHITPRKRVYDLIITFYELLQMEDSFHLHIAGDNHPAYEDYATALSSLVKNLNIENKVTFSGFITNPWDWYKNIDIFISNSYSEGLQVAPMEAMATGCYPLIHRWKGAEELAPEDNLYLTNKELNAKLIEYHKTSDIEKQLLCKKMRNHVCEKFDIEKTNRRIHQIIEEVVSDF